MRRRLPSTSLSVEIEVLVARPPAVVWRIVSDPRMAAEWLDEIVSSEQQSPGEPGVGTLVRYTVKGGRSGTFELVGWEPGRLFAWDGPGLPWLGGAMRPRGSFEVAPAEDGRTRFRAHYEPELTGTLVLLRPMLLRWLRRQRTADMQLLKQRLERGDFD